MLEFLATLIVLYNCNITDTQYRCEKLRIHQRPTFSGELFTKSEFIKFRRDFDRQLENKLEHCAQYNDEDKYLTECEGN